MPKTLTKQEELLARREELMGKLEVVGMGEMLEVVDEIYKIDADLNLFDKDM